VGAFLSDRPRDRAADAAFLVGIESERLAYQTRVTRWATCRPRQRDGPTHLLADDSLEAAGRRAGAPDVAERKGLRTRCTRRQARRQGVWLAHLRESVAPAVRCPPCVASAYHLLR